MTDKKLTDSEFVKALECCCEDSGCPDICPLKDMAYVGDCVQVKSKHALDLINRQKAEIEKLESDLETLNGQYLILDMAIETAKAEAYKECIEKVKDFLKQNGFMFCSDADNILKEMEGEK